MSRETFPDVSLAIQSSGSCKIKTQLIFYSLLPPRFPNYKKKNGKGQVSAGIFFFVEHILMLYTYYIKRFLGVA